jgi:phosphomannomutase
LDSCNGASSVFAPRLLHALGAQVSSINTTPNGTFPRGAEPTAENLSALCELVRASGANVGFAQDMDADRLAIIDETGEPIGEDQTLALATRYVLSKTPGTVVTNLSTSSALDDVAKLFNVTLHRTKIGEANVTELMQRVNAVIGGEGNGGVIYPRLNYCRDSHVAMALVLHLLAETDKTVAQLVKELPRYSMAKEKLACPSDKISAVLKMMREEFATYPQDLRDGVKVTLPNGWLHVRGSNTEPIIRLTAEAGDEGAARAILSGIFANVSRLLNAVTP